MSRPPQLLLAGILLSVFLTGCANKPTETPPAVQPANTPAAGKAQAGKKITVCLLPKKKGIPYFTSCAKGARKRRRSWATST